MHSYRIVTRRLNFFEKLIFMPYPQLFLLWILLNAAFTAAYFALTTLEPAHGLTIPAPVSTLERLFDCLYFSVVTAATVGYGDITAFGISKLLAMIESTAGLLVFSVLVGKLVGQRQDVTLREVHRMSFEGIFYHIRHVLFIVRQDFDDIIRKVNTQKELQENDWRNVMIAYLQAHSLIEEIPDLYDTHGFDLRNVNLNKERLLFEALHRTLQRVHELMITLNEHGIKWRTHAASLKELRRLIDVTDAVMPVWRERSPFHEEAEFDEILSLTAKLHADLKTAAA